MLNCGVGLIGEKFRIVSCKWQKVIVLNKLISEKCVPKVEDPFFKQNVRLDHKILLTSPVGLTCLECLYKHQCSYSEVILEVILKAQYTDSVSADKTSVTGICDSNKSEALSPPLHKHIIIHH
jgi:hypothetical protein